jgi:hypothetical protein
MALQRTTEGHTGQHSYSREAAEPFAIKGLRETFKSYPPKEQARIRADVIARLRTESRSHEFAACDGKGRRPGSALSRLAGPVYGITERDL